MAKSNQHLSKLLLGSKYSTKHPSASPRPDTDTDERTRAPGGRECELFLQALEQPTPAARAAFLDNVCANDASLRAALEELLAHHANDEFLETPAVGAGLLRTARPSVAADVRLGGLTEKAGDRIGAYKLLQKIGEGGCGVVYMAEQQEPVRRRVALKIIKLGMDTKQVIARFEAERQALAMMDHPNIAKVLDAGATQTGRPFFVMELVRGTKFTEFSDENELSTEQRLELFMAVCHAVRHAHQKGIIHRDLKPSNVLVTLHDGVPVPKVIDFGIVKATVQPLTDKTLFTDFHAFLGTPAYTSPEQAEMSGLDVDTRSDIYSLGVLLYELLTGQTPFDPAALMRCNLDEMRRIIREEEPERPSTRLSTLGMAEATALCRTRHAHLPLLLQTVRGDLDWIVMKCLEKDRNRRYQTADALSTDIFRYLENEPVSARPPSAAYQLSKFVRRHRTRVYAGGAIALVIVLAAIVSTWLAVRATQAEREESRLRRAMEYTLTNESRERRKAQREQVAALRRAYNSDMNLVQQALSANNMGRVIELLNRQIPETELETDDPAVRASLDPQHKPDFRQWEWRYFRDQSRSQAAFALPQQDSSIHTLLLSPDAKLLVFDVGRGLLHLWDLPARKELAALPHDGMGMGGVTFSHDGAQLAIAQRRSGRSSVALWSVGARQFTAEFEEDGSIAALAFSADDSKLLTFDGRAGAIRAWIVERRELDTTTAVLQESGRGPGPGRAIFSADAMTLAVLQSDRIHVFDSSSGQERCLTEPLRGGVAGLALSPDGKLIAVGPSFSGTNTAISLYSAETGQSAGELVGHRSWVPSLIFTGDGTKLVSAGADQSLRLWTIPDGRELAVLRGHRSEIYTVTVNGSGSEAVSGCKDGTIYSWDLEHVQQRPPFSLLPVPVSSVSFGPDGQRLFSVNVDGSVDVWDPVTLRRVESLESLGREIRGCVVAPDGSRIYARTRSGRIKVLDWPTRQLITNLIVTAEPAPFWPGADSSAMALVRDGHALVVESAGGWVRVFDTSSWQRTAEWRFSDGFSPPFPRAFTLTGDGRSFVASGPNGSVGAFDLLTGETRELMPGSRRRVSALAISPDGLLLAVASGDGAVDVWDCVHRTLVDVLRGTLLNIEGLAFSPDGQRLATSSHGNEAVKLWDVGTRHEVATLAGEGSLFRKVLFSPNGEFLVAINTESQAHLWHAPALEAIDGLPKGSVQSIQR